MRRSTRPAGAAGPQADRRRLRSRLLLLGAVAALVVLLFAVKVTAMLDNDSAGRETLDGGDPAAAAPQFAANRTLNWWESWVAPFGEGTARLAAGDPEAAIEPLQEALASAPVEHRCRVRINLALAHELIAEGLLASPGQVPDPGAAAARWREALLALLEDGCAAAVAGDEVLLADVPEAADVLDSDGAAGPADADTVAERIRSRLQEPPPGQDPSDPPPQEDDEDDEAEQDDRESELEQRNRDAEAEQRERRRENEGEGQLGEGPTW